MTLFDIFKSLEFKTESVQFVRKIDSETALMDGKPARCCKYGLKSDPVLMQSSRTARTLGYLNVLGRFKSEINTVDLLGKRVHILEQKIRKTYFSKILTTRCNYV